jgi:DNA-directed RNA polymerase II subunit RPB2
MIREPIPIIILLRALGINNDLEVFQRVNPDQTKEKISEILKPSFDEAEQYMTQEQCLDYIARRGSGSQYTRDRRIDYAMNILASEMLPHVSTSKDGFLRKTFFIGYMVNRLIQANLGGYKEDDRDYYGKKRMDMAGSLITLLFKNLFNTFTKDMVKNIEKLVDDGKKIQLESVMKNMSITTGLKSAVSTGNWGKDRYQNVAKTGVAQVLNRLTFLSSLSALRRLNTPLSKQGKLTKPRQLHNSHWGMICPAETPEGSACGLVKNLSLMSFVSVGSAQNTIIDICSDFGMQDLREVSVE